MISQHVRLLQVQNWNSHNPKYKALDDTSEREQNALPAVCLQTSDITVNAHSSPAPRAKFKLFQTFKFVHCFTATCQQKF